MSMAASSHQSGEVAASVEVVTDVLDHLTVTTHQVHRAIAVRPPSRIDAAQIKGVLRSHCPRCGPPCRG
jgi:hypothetical protein